MDYPPAYYFTLKKDQEAELTEFLDRHGGTHIERLIFLSKMTLWASGRFNDHLWADRELDWDMAGQAFEVAAAAETQLHSDLKMARVGGWKGPKY
ncbi:MAG: hypothetical protein Q7T61_19015 [Caulobacter sp.]|nr:hypothetical protein [Caulobacter sp.]